MTGTVMRTRSASVVSTTTTPVFQAMTGWMPTIAIQQLRCVISVVNRSPNLSVTLGIQTAQTDPEIANGPLAIGPAIVVPGRAFRDIDVTVVGNGNVNASMWFRLGVFAASAGVAVETGTVSLTPAFR
jgi:hypothetical protein